MKIAVLGAGLMGKEATRDLVNSAGVEKVTLADVDVKRAEGCMPAAAIYETIICLLRCN